MLSGRLARRRLVAPGARRLALAIAMAGLAGLLTGCQAGGGADLTIRSTTVPNALLRGGFDRGFYRVDGDQRMTMVLYDGSEAAPDQVLVIRMLWRPRAGRTPVESTATNATLHHVIFAGPSRDEVGVYAGGGFLYPHDRLGRRTLTAGLWDSSLRLTDGTSRFVDRLGQAVARGRLRVIRDDDGVPRRLREVNLALRERLGYTRMVHGRADDGLGLAMTMEP